MADSHCPLSQEDCAALNVVLESGARVRKLIQDCKDCGIPVDGQEERLNMVTTMAERLKAKFFPEAT